MLYLLAFVLFALLCAGHIKMREQSWLRYFTLAKAGNFFAREVPVPPGRGLPILFWAAAYLIVTFLIWLFF